MGNMGHGSQNVTHCQLWSSTTQVHMCRLSWNFANGRV